MKCALEKERWRGLYVSVCTCDNRHGDYVCVRLCERGGQKLVLSVGQVAREMGTRASSKSGEFVGEASAIQHVRPNKCGKGSE